MKKVSIERTKLKDIDDILIVEKLCFTIKWSRQSFLDEILGNDKAMYWSAIINETVIGYGGFWKVYDEGQVTNIAVHPDYRRLGIGSKFVEQFIKTANSEGLKSIILEVRESNINAQNLYKKQGFKNIGLRKSYYGDNGENALIMSMGL